VKIELSHWILEWGGVLIVASLIALFVLEFVLDHLLQRVWSWLFDRKPKRPHFPWSDRNGT